MDAGIQALIVEGQAAFRRGDGKASQRAFEAALASGERGDLLEGLARALYVDGEYRASIDAHERACAAYHRERNAMGAARAARMLGWLHGNLYGDTAVANGWYGRACTFLEEAGPDGVEHGWVEHIRAMSEPLLARREAGYRRALAIARRFGDLDLEFEALGWVGLVLVFDNRPAEGMPMLDEALAAVCGGEVDDVFVVEGVFCGLFWACERAQDVARAEQWMRAADEFVRRRGLTAIGAFCRAHYGSILTAAGRWSEAEATLTEAANVFGGGFVSMRSEVLVRLADLRLRQGRLEEAAQLLDGLDQHADAVRPLAGLYLARGQVELARDLLERALADELGVQAGPLLALAVDAHLAAGAIDAAGQAADRLETMAAQFPGDYMHACAALARGKVCLASGTGDGRASLRTALAAFARAQMPMELAWTRLELARAVATERPEVAVAEARAALAAFESMAVAHGADASAALLRSLGAVGRASPRQRGELTRREAEVLDLLGQGRSNVEIGQRLCISAKTVEHHVGHILSKLALRNRAEAAVYAVRGVDPKVRAGM